MKKHTLVLILLAGLFGASMTQSEIEDSVQNFSLTNATDNSVVSLSSYSKSKAVVVVFSSPSCAFSRHYDDRLIELAKSFQDKGVTFLMINPNNPDISPEDNTSSMIKRAQEKKYPFPFLIDNNQIAANLLGATKTPEAFVLKYTNGAFSIKYKGAIDDNPQLASEVRVNYLQDAIQSVINSSIVKISEKKATGCTIKK